ncbi:MAG: hypothetical protein IJT14_01625 [Rickettsiales bacterium]|nr:hypothetical protein [Rickettsiales bacterium]
MLVVFRFRFMQKPTHPDRYAQFVLRKNKCALNTNYFDSNPDFSDDKIMMYDKKMKKVLVPKIDAERKHMQEGHIYADKDLNSKEENKKLDKFLQKKEKQAKNKNNKSKTKTSLSKQIKKNNKKDKDLSIKTDEGKRNINKTVNYCFKQIKMLNPLNKN